MANEYATRATLKSHLNIEASDTSRDTLLDAALAAASRGIDRATGRRFWLDPSTGIRTYNPTGRVVCGDAGERLIVDDIGGDSIVVETGSGGSYTTLAATDWEASPDNALVRGRPISGLTRLGSAWPTGGGSRIRVTARWGWPAVPDEIAQATVIQAARLYRRKDSPEGVTGSAEWGVVRLSRRDPDVWALIEHFVLPGFGGG